MSQKQKEFGVLRVLLHWSFNFMCDISKLLHLCVMYKALEVLFFFFLSSLLALFSYFHLFHQLLLYVRVTRTRDANMIHCVPSSQAL